MDGGAWWAAVHGVAKSQTWLSNFTFTFHLHALEKEMATHSSVLAWRSPGTGEPGGLSSLGSHRVGHDWSDLAAAEVHACILIILLSSCIYHHEPSIQYFFNDCVVATCRWTVWKTYLVILLLLNGGISISCVRTFCFSIIGVLGTLNNWFS